MRLTSGQLTSGTRVQARGLTWDVLEREDLGEQQRLHLRCLDDDLLGLEWDILHPHEPVVPERDTLDPEHPGSLAAWRLLHQAALLDEIPGADTMVAAEPGRIQIEPYQLVPLMRALELPRPRLLLADGVGLGKTIEAGLIAAELIARRRAHRILIVAPAGPLLRQWEQEMRTRFGLAFTVLADSATLREEQRKLELGGNPFGATSFVLTSLDFAKQEAVLEDIERTAWDLAIIDEAHHCVGAAHAPSREDTQRRRLAEVVARQSDGLLLLTATPHDGYDPHFASLMELLDPSLVDGQGALMGLAYRRHVVRRLKSHITDPSTGRPLFRERKVIPIPVATDDPDVRAFHRGLSDLVVPRLDKARAFGDALAFVSLLKRSVSTIAACVATLRVVADRYTGLVDHHESDAAKRERTRTLRAFRRRAMRYGVLDSQTETDVERLEAEDIAADLVATGDTEAALRALIRRGEIAAGSDPKLEALVDEIRAIRGVEPRANILVYTEYGDSQAAAVRALRGIGGEVLTIAGQDSEEARTLAAERCATDENLILVSTDSLAEGLNLQRRCHHLIHLDLPYNPNRLEQRNGRIDRYGQTEEPEIRYLCLAGTFEERLLLRLIGKYEKARNHLTFMPDTLGVTAAEERYGNQLLSGLAEEQATLFPDDKATIRTLDVAADEAQSSASRALLHEIDRAYEGFDGMAVRHGWFAGQGLSADAALMRAAVGVRRTATRQAALVDLAAFVSNSIGQDPPPGRADPTVRRAIGHVRQGGDGRVSVARYEQRGLLLTYSMEIQTPRYVAFQRAIAVLLPENGPPEVLHEPHRWLAFASPEHALTTQDAWTQFAHWAPPRLPDAEVAAVQAVQGFAAAFATQHAAAWDADRDNLERWIARRADTLCGPGMPAVTDLFGPPTKAPLWTFAGAPIERLGAYVADGANPDADRRAAEAAIVLYRRRLRSMPRLSAPVLHRIGMLMLIPPA